MPSGAPPVVTKCASDRGLGKRAHGGCRLASEARGGTGGPPSEATRLGAGPGARGVPRVAQPPTAASSRMQTGLHSFRAQLPVLSDSERDMKKELQLIPEQLRHLGNAIKQVGESARRLACPPPPRPASARGPWPDARSVGYSR